MVMAYQERHVDTWNLGTPVRGNASDYVESQSLTQFTIRPPDAGRKRVVLAYVKNKYHDGEDGKIFQRFQDRAGPLIGLFVITTFPVFFGCEYVVRVIDCDQNTGFLENVEFKVRSQRNKEEQEMFMDNIWNLVDTSSMVDGKLFRDIDINYHPELRITGSTISGTLKPRQRSKSGHPFNLAFDRVPVLHLSTCDSQNSWYASTRVTIPPECIFDEEMGLLLTGMHCYDGAHYVDLKLAKIGSDVYNDLVKDGARKLDIKSNPFFTYNAETKEIKCASKMRLREGQTIPTTLVVEIALAEKEVHLVNAPVRQIHLIERYNRCPRANTDCKMCFPMNEPLENILLSEHQVLAVLSNENSPEMYWMFVEDPDQLPVDAVLQDPDNHITGMTSASFFINSIHSCEDIRRVLLCIIRGSNSNTEYARFFKYTEDKEPIWIFIPPVYRGYRYDIRVLGEKRTTRELVEHFKLEVRTPF